MFSSSKPQRERSVFRNPVKELTSGDHLSKSQQNCQNLTKFVVEIDASDLSRSCVGALIEHGMSMAVLDLNKAGYSKTRSAIDVIRGLAADFHGHYPLLAIAVQFHDDDVINEQAVGAASSERVSVKPFFRGDSIIDEISDDFKFGSCSNQLEKDVRFAVETQVDFVVLTSRNQATLAEIRNQMLFWKCQHGVFSHSIQLIAKIDRSRESIESFERILCETDGIILVSVHGQNHRSWLEQRALSAKSLFYTRKFFICEGDDDPRNLFDVANCVLDMVDGIYTFPDKLDCLKRHLLARMIQAIEAESWTSQSLQILKDLQSKSVRKCRRLPMVEVAVLALARISALIRPQAVITTSPNGYEARLLSRYRLGCPVVCLTSSESVAKKLMVYRNCFPLLMLTDQVKLTDDGCLDEAVSAVRGVSEGPVNVIVFRRKSVKSAIWSGLQIISIGAD